jgi:large subunit ribosomal protein L15
MQCALLKTNLLFPEDHPLPKQNRILVLHDLRNIPGATKKKKRVGRGRGSGIGKTSRRGHKGSGQRGHPIKPWFEGGMTPFYKRIPKVGIHKDRKPLTILTIRKLMEFVQKGRVDPRLPITLHTVQHSNLVKVRNGVKLVADGEELLNIPLTLELTHATEEAVEAVERAGGSIKFIYTNKQTLSALLYPHKHAILPRRLPLPLNPRKAQIFVEQLPDLVGGKRDSDKRPSFTHPKNPYKYQNGGTGRYTPPEDGIPEEEEQ